VETMEPHMVSVLPYGSHFDFVTYVPTATKRVRTRGFDHAQLLAGHVAKRVRVPNVGLLVKTNQHRQVGSSRAERQRNMDDSFRPVRKSLIKGSRLLIIDDVVSTGSTLRACAKVLKQNGAKSVDALVFAK